ncbi:arsenosugar biosynthesis radical SAM (seleno)protein ArsS [Haliangium ochraceum]|uniref:Radical SAM domain protein n=1 Tax=Haliangium ochraceum (strain DSM 14365 / JCM 11303 / SMP-2) TaxID=502025 RepID=D0LHR2_HALO1|nr:arsenosugar biosynthesis radical SAM (seleno)protein ArsS [Haliangium ochraceum]ACY12924.1 Radical SAM domain protein [Haliangium ochraceum DSM 14365]
MPTRAIRVLPAPARFDDALRKHGAPPLAAAAIDTLQINLGKRCNQACLHCHVEAGPNRSESMSAATAERLVALLERSPAVRTVDITGGAPELNPHFRDLVRAARARERAVIDRCNLTILFEPGQDDLDRFLAEHRVHVIASLPCYGPENVEQQRGGGVFAKSIAALRRLNQLGYGAEGSELRLDLVYNPLGPSLPGDQAALERSYKERLAADHGLRFHSLYTITNMPIRRFAHALERDGQLEAYMRLLVENFNPGAVAGLMCRSQINIGYDGALYDCDFNQMLELASSAPSRARASHRVVDRAAEHGRENDGRDEIVRLDTFRPPTIWDIDSFAELHERRIATGEHCFGCTAGAGSSCGGALLA